MQFNECYSVVQDLGGLWCRCTCNARARWGSSGFEKLLASDVEIDTSIKFHEFNSMANVTGGGVHRARAHVQSGKAPLS